MGRWLVAGDDADAKACCHGLVTLLTAARITTVRLDHHIRRITAIVSSRPCLAARATHRGATVWVNDRLRPVVGGRLGGMAPQRPLDRPATGDRQWQPAAGQVCVPAPVAAPEAQAGDVLTQLRQRRYQVRR